MIQNCLCQKDFVLCTCSKNPLKNLGKKQCPCPNRVALYICVECAKVMWDGQNQACTNPECNPPVSAWCTINACTSLLVSSSRWPNKITWSWIKLNALRVQIVALRLYHVRWTCQSWKWYTRPRICANKFETGFQNNRCTVTRLPD